MNADLYVVMNSTRPNDWWLATCNKAKAQDHLRQIIEADPSVELFRVTGLELVENPLDRKIPIA